MNTAFTLLLMIFCHIIADYNLQGWLASAKQKSYWDENVQGKEYRHDYIMALFMHSFEWPFMIMLPIAYNYKFNIDPWFVVFFYINVFTHMLVDHMKANLKNINLCQDQAIHLIQIFVTFLELRN